VRDRTPPSLPEGWLYVVAVLDLFSRRVVGRSKSTMTTLLATDPLVMAIGGRVRPQLCCITPIVIG
jgi:hypothetical protein